MADEVTIDVLHRRLMCENSKFYVYFDHIVDGKDEEVMDYLVVSPKNTNANLITGVAILPIVDEQVGLVRIYRPAIRDFSWEIPHGFLDKGENDHTSANRELLEETGLVVKEISSLGFLTPDAGILAARVHLYQAECYPGSVQRQKELGLRDFRYFTFEEIDGKIKQSIIQDSFTIVAWSKYKLLK